jgi:hypothetical protein
MVEVVSHDSFFPAPPPLAFADGFVIEEGAPGLPGAGPARGARLPCGHVRGFDAALDAALDPRTAPPARLVLVTPEEDTSTWLERWAEDADQVRRALVIRRARDGAEVVIIATLASHGYGVPTSLAIESVRAREETDILRSGVHRKVDVEAALARRAAEVDAHPPT